MNWSFDLITYQDINDSMDSGNMNMVNDGKMLLKISLVDISNQMSMERMVLGDHTIFAQSIL